MVLIRPYQAADRAAVRKIFQDTAHLGQSYRHFFDDGEWLADIMTAGYTDFEPEGCFVAEEKGVVVGYLTGTCDTSRYRARWKIKIFPRVAGGFFRNGLWRNWRAWRFFLSGARSMVRGEEITPPGLEKNFPAHFHINMASGHRGGGSGKQLAAAFFSYLQSKNVFGVHVRTASPEPKQRFFESLGFQPLLVKPLTVWEYLGQSPYHIITYGLSLKK